MFKISMENVELFTQLEITHYEFNSYIDILADMRNNNTNYNENYWRIWKEYINILGEYETLKEKLRVEFIVPIVGEGYGGNWEANFDEGIVYIYEPNNLI